jgi:hypothetical protein
LALWLRAWVMGWNWCCDGDMDMVRGLLGVLGMPGRDGRVDAEAEAERVRPPVARAGGVIVDEEDGYRLAPPELPEVSGRE